MAGMRTTDLTRRYWDADTARRVLAAWRKSGHSLVEFARKYGVNAQRLSWWRKRLEAGEEGRPGAGPLTFVPAHVTGLASVASLVVRLPGGVVVEALDAGAVAPGWIAELAQALGRPA
jgi:transposase-like protein